MHIILLSGGSGKRLWPLSHGTRTKVFLKLLTSPDGGKESMIQRVVRQLGDADLLKSALVVSHHTQTEITRNHIGDRIPIISERHRRGTFPAVALATTYFYSKLHADEKDIVCFLPADQYVESSFFDMIKRLPDILDRSGAELSLIGTAPTHPSSQFGYIVPAPESETDYHRIERFVEKPDEQLAKQLIAQKAMWNCGVYAFRLGFLLTILKKANLPVLFDHLLEHMPQSSELSFDREVAERTTNSIMVPYPGTWLDLGSWDSLSARLGSPVTGTGTVSGQAIDTHLVNELDIPIHVIGGHRLIVAAGPDGILVANKQDSHQIKEILTDAENHSQIMYEEKRWGTKKLLDYTAAGQTECRTSRVRIAAGKHTSYHLHQSTAEKLLVLEGDGEIIKDGALIPVSAGQLLEFPPGCRHGLRATTSLTYLEIHIGPHNVSNDHIRLDMDWPGEAVHSPND
ncbi:sugar phosphate nucleotidyltransferase [Paenibacillus silviterrae]|uniref:sugar phosphate nucleotidyltransferase n=1 Tax=Paenibacillus silviterrae TaxID=3242194 RepID=UPI002543B452|nr:sugar phosphate nucleotidyltransferase [Paenibacillus chinjuensis]